ncbi:MAG: hypothetical protein GC182_07160 [Rhodopseudomonas sp.]|nr:hypothetical protein [Rhodopseudomonas sp.]
MNKELLTVLDSIAREADSGQFERRDFKGVLTGFSGEKLMHCLQALTRALCGKDAVYVEIGVFQGLTLLSNAVANPGVDCFGIDNFSLFNEGKGNFALVQERMKKLGVTNATIINADYEDALHHLASHIGPRKVGVFFVDGPHDYRSQLLPLLLAKPFLAENCAIVVDDSNYAHVRQANGDFLRSEPEFALLFEAYTRAHIANLPATEKAEVAAGWWNGAHVMVRDPSGLIPRAYPAEDAKHLYVESHETFRHEFAELAFPALKAAQTMLDGTPEQANEAMARLKTMLIEARRDHPDRFKNQNTYSERLPQFKLHA